MLIPLLLQISVSETLIPMERFYSFFGITRQGFFQALKRLEEEKMMMKIVRNDVIEYRNKKDRRAGSRSLFHNLDIKNTYNVGINKFEQLMSKYDLTLVPLDIRIVTTKSCLQSWNYNNLIRGLELTSINKVLVGDITYISFGSKRYYLFCLIDLYSYRIVGYNLGERMRSIEGLACLKMAIKTRGKENLEGCIHHTDGGGQYFSGPYIKLLSKIGIDSSRAENCLENGYAEQRNGIIKNHLIPTIEANTLKELKRQFTKSIMFYNHERKQEKLDWLTPVQFESKDYTYKRKIY